MNCAEHQYLAGFGEGELPPCWLITRLATRLPVVGSRGMTERSMAIFRIERFRDLADILSEEEQA
jgi:hypothetical protein